MYWPFHTRRATIHRIEIHSAGRAERTGEWGAVHAAELTDSDAAFCRLVGYAWQERHGDLANGAQDLEDGKRFSLAADESWKTLLAASRRFVVEGEQRIRLVAERILETLPENGMLQGRRLGKLLDWLGPAAPHARPGLSRGAGQPAPAHHNLAIAFEAHEGIEHASVRAARREKRLCRITFYKYRDFDEPEHLKSAIVKHEFFFDSPNNFNDPFECLPSFTFEATETEIVAYYQRIVARNFPDLSEYKQIVRALEHRLTADREQQPGSPEYKRFHIGRYRESVPPKLPMFCMSTTQKNVLLWSHYARNHTGVCLQFDAYSPNLIEAQPVKYRTTRPEVNPLVTVPEQIMENTVLVKAKDWAYEEEWRVVSFGKPAGIRVFKPETLTGIIFGHKTCHAHKEMVKCVFQPIVDGISG